MERVARLSLERPILILGLIALATIPLAMAIPRIPTETGYRAYLGADHPTVVQLDDFIDGFGGGLPIGAAWSCLETEQCQTVFDDVALEMAGVVVHKLQSLAGVRRVESPATTPILVVTADSLDARSIVDGSGLAAGRDLREHAAANSTWHGILVSEDQTAGAIVVELASSDSDASRDVLRALQSALKPFEAQGFHFHVFGQTAQFALTDEALAADSHRLLPVMIALVSTVVLLLFRSWQAVVSSLATVGLASTWTAGAQGIFGWPQNAIMQTVPPLILVISLCVSIHVLSRYMQRRATTAAISRADRKVALIGAAGDAGPACLATTVTTAAGFLSFSASGLESFVRFGFVSAWGIASAFVLSFTLLPILTIGLPADRIRSTRASEVWDRALAAVVRGTRSRARAIAAGGAVLTGFCLYGALGIQVDVDEYELYGEDSAVVRSFRFLERYLRKPDTLEIELLLPANVNLDSTKTIQALVKLNQSLESVHSLGPARSVLDAMAWMNRLLSGDDPAFERPGETDAKNAQLLTLLALKDPEALDRWVSPDLRRVRFSVEAEKLPTSGRAEVIREVRGAIADRLGEGWSARLTGSFVVYDDMTREIQQTQILSFGVAAGVVFLVLAIFLRTRGGSSRAALGWAAIGMFPTILPVVVTFGVMGLAGIRLDLGTAMVAAIIIGIGVDDTIHLLGEFCRFRRDGVAASTAIERAVQRVGQAILTTSAALTAGFFVLTLSSWQSISSFGFLSGIAILGALAADLWLLPALVFLTTGDSGRAPRRGGTPSEDAPPRSRRVTMTLIALLPLTCVSAVASLATRQAGSERVLACRTMPNGVVPVIAGSDSRCNLRRLDRVVGIEDSGSSIPATERDDFLTKIAQHEGNVPLIVERSGERRRIEVPTIALNSGDRAFRFVSAVAGALVLVGFGLRIYWNSNAAAASALLVLFATIGAEIVSIVSAGSNDALSWVSAPIAPFIGAALAHLALTYPRERALVRAAPRVVLIPYSLAAPLAVVELSGLGDEPSFWVLNVRFDLFFTCAAAVLLVVGSVRSAMDTSEPLNRARARLLLFGSTGIAAILCSIYFGWGEGVPGGHLTPLLGGILLFLVPLGFAITRYDLFDLPDRAREILDAFLRVGSVGALSAAAAGAIHAATEVDGPVLWGTGAIAGFTTGIYLHNLLHRLMGHRVSPNVNRRRQLLIDHEKRMSELTTQDVSAKLVGRTLEAGIDSTGVAVFLRDGAGWRPGYAGREHPAFRSPFAHAAERALSDRSFLHLARGDISDTDDTRYLRDANVELIVPVMVDQARLGLILVGARATGRAFAAADIAFVRSAAAHAGVALFNAQIASRTLASRRKATITRLLSEIVHDLGSGLRVIERRLRRIIERADDAESVRQESEKVDEVTRYLIRTVYGLIDSAGTSWSGDHPTIEEVIGYAIDAVDYAHDRERVLVSVAPAVPRVPSRDRLVRVLTNLLNNALRASNEDDAVWIYATGEGNRLRVEVIDRGRGMSPEEVERAFDPFYTTRRADGGMGIGLAICRELVRELRGEISLDSVRGSGTRAVVHIPVVTS